MMMTPFEIEKRKRNLAQGYKETKGLKNGHCNRAACQAPLASHAQCYMSDHEMCTHHGRLYYCIPCKRQFDKADREFGITPPRCIMENDDVSLNQP